MQCGYTSMASPSLAARSTVVVAAAAAAAAAAASSSALLRQAPLQPCQRTSRPVGQGRAFLCSGHLTHCAGALERQKSAAFVVVLHDVGLRLGREEREVERIGPPHDRLNAAVTRCDVRRPAVGP